MANKKRLSVMKEDYKKLAIETLVALKMQVWRTEQALKQINKTLYKENTK